jgi:hypothetical protein
MKNNPGNSKYRILWQHDHEWAKIHFRDDSIVEVHLLPGLYNGEKVLSIIDKIKELSDEPLLLVLTITDRHSMVTYSGIQAVFSKPAVIYSIAKAYLFHNRMQFFLANVGRLIFRPKVPIRFFKNREDAEKWLGSFRGYGM